MIKRLNKIREPYTDGTLSGKIIRSFLILLLGIVLGAFSKWLDNMGIDDRIWLQRMIGLLDLRNVFSLLAVWFFVALTISVYSRTPLRAAVNVFLFFLGMCTSYHLYTVLFSGFNPRSYMMIWYALTVVSPLFAVICWYGKGKTKVSFAIDILILGVMVRACFTVGFWYFDCNNIVNLFIFAGSVLVLYSTPLKTLFSVPGGVILAFLMRLIR